MTTEIDWGDLGEAWWREAGANCHATEQQIIFALHRHQGMTATGCAKAAGYAGDDASIRQAGHRAAHSTAVMGLLSMAKAETGRGPDGNVTMTEAKQILSRLARGSDPNVRIKAIESLAKIEAGEREYEARQAEQETSLQQEIAEVAKLSPELAEEYAKAKGMQWSVNGVANDSK
jgi:phage terminase small subunit